MRGGGGGGGGFGSGSDTRNHTNPFSTQFSPLKIQEHIVSEAHLLVPELDEAHGLLEGVLGVAARVEDVRAQPDAPENLGVGVDLVQGVHHGLHALKAETGWN